MHCSISHCRVKEKALVATTIYIYDLFPTSPFSFTFCCAHTTHTSKRYPATNLQPTSAQITWLKVLLIWRRFLTIICINSGLCSHQDYFPAGNGDHFGSIILDFSALLCQKQCACFNSTVKVLCTTPLGDIQHIPNPPIATPCNSWDISAIYRQYIGTCCKYIFLKYIGNISGLATLARHSLGRWIFKGVKH